MIIAKLVRAFKQYWDFIFPPEEKGVHILSTRNWCKISEEEREELLKYIEEWGKESDK